MTADEYDAFLSDPADYVLRVYLPRIFKALEPLQRLPSLTALFLQRYKGSVTSAALASPDIAGAFESLYRSGLESARFLARSAQFDKEMSVEATKTVFGGLVASGWHTAALAMRLIVDHYLSHVASLGSPGVDELRWLKPVRPGNRLSLRVSIVETRRSRTRPDRGIVRSLVEVINQDHEVVMSSKGMNMLQCRDASPSGS